MELDKKQKLLKILANKLPGNMPLSNSFVIDTSLPEEDETVLSSTLRDFQVIDSTDYKDYKIYMSHSSIAVVILNQNNETELVKLYTTFYGGTSLPYMTGIEYDKENDRFIVVCGTGDGKEIRLLNNFCEPDSNGDYILKNLTTYNLNTSTSSNISNFKTSILKIPNASKYVMLSIIPVGNLLSVFAIATYEYKVGVDPVQNGRRFTLEDILYWGGNGNITDVILTGNKDNYTCKVLAYVSQNDIGLSPGQAMRFVEITANENNGTITATGSIFKEVNDTVQVLPTSVSTREIVDFYPSIKYDKDGDIVAMYTDLGTQIEEQDAWYYYNSNKLISIFEGNSRSERILYNSYSIQAATALSIHSNYGSIIRYNNDLYMYSQEVKGESVITSEVKNTIGMLINKQLYTHDSGLTRQWDTSTAKRGCLILKENNLVKFGVFDKDKLKVNISIYNAEGYNGEESSTKESCTSQDGVLRNSDNVPIYAKNFYNKTNTNNVINATINVLPNELNNVVISKEETRSLTGGTVNEEEKIIKKNQYENLFINFIDTINVIDDNDNLGIIQQRTSNVISNSIYTGFTINDNYIAKYKVYYDDDTSQVYSFAPNNILVMPDDPNKLKITMLVKNGAKKIEILTYDEVTTFVTIDFANRELPAGQYLKIIEYVRVE